MSSFLALEAGILTAVLGGLAQEGTVLNAFAIS